jgi:hypothetical protein
MEFRNTIEALQTNADEIVLLLSILKKQEGLKRIDIDLILDKLRSMYDLMLDIQTTIGPQSGDFNKIQPEPEVSAPLFRDVQKINIPEQKFVIAGSEAKDETEGKKVIKKEKSVDATPEIAVEKTLEDKLKERKQTARTNIEQDLKKEKEEQNESGQKKAIISDRFKTAKPTLAEELGSKRKFDDLATQLKSQGTSGISTSFGLNEKFEIINELFGGNMEQFEHTLQVISAAGSFVEAYNYLKENFSWDMDNQYVQRLLEQIRRKLIVQRKDE